MRLNGAILDTSHKTTWATKRGNPGTTSRCQPIATLPRVKNGEHRNLVAVLLNSRHNDVRRFNQLARPMN
jgi:hypothetical protein